MAGMGTDNEGAGNALLAAALQYAARGWHVLPLRPAGKQPLTRHGCQEATADAAAIVAWWRRWPQANVGIACGPSGLVVIDLDRDKGGLEAWADLRRRYAFDDATVMALTGGGGMHLYYRAPADLPIGNSAGRLGPGIDVRGSGGYVVAPPSRHPSGRPYTWDVGFHPDETAIAPLPPPLTQLLAAPVKGHAETATPASSIPEGRRNAALASLAGSMRRRGMSREAIVAALTVTNRERCQPPLPPAEVERIARSVARYPAAEDGASSPEAALAALPRTDAGNAEAFVALHHDRFRYDHRRHTWLAWDGARWREDADGEAERAMIETVRRRRAALAAQIKEPAQARPAMAWAFGQEARARLRAALEITRVLEPLPVLSESLDRDPYLLATPNGTLDLHTGRLGKARREDLLTRLTGVGFDPDAACPRWLEFLDQVFDGDHELVAFVQRAAGYSLTGDVREHALFILYGTGANGKTTFLETLKAIWGEYARTTPFATFQAGNRDDKRVDLAGLQGVRLVCASEGDDGHRLAEAQVKAMTGGDAISCRRLYGEFFEYHPSFKVWLATNSKPIIRGTDRGIWRRIRLIPFTRQFTGRTADPALPAKLQAEAAGILAWAVAGCLAWQKDGLDSPPAVQEATEAYRLEQDRLGQFLADCTVTGPQGSVRAADLYRAYERWCRDNGEQPMSGTAFGRQMAERGVAKLRDRTGLRYQGLALATRSV